MNEHDIVALLCNLPDVGLCAGDIGSIVHVYGGGKGYEVEFATLSGDTVAVVTLPPDRIRTVGQREIAQARPMAI